MATVRSPSDADPTAERWLVGLAKALDREERALETPSFDELVAASEEELDEGEASLWAERTTRDPGLASRAAALARFRAEAYPEIGRLIVLPRRRVPIRRLGWFVAAAGVLLAMVVGLSGGSRQGPARIEAHRAAPAAPPASDVLFQDGFEQGDSSSWSAVSSSG